MEKNENMIEPLSIDIIERADDASLRLLFFSHQMNCSKVMSDGGKENIRDILSLYLKT